MAQEHVYLDAGMKGWLVRKANEEHWRMSAWYELDDLIQDGYICYCKCVRSYPQLAEIKNPDSGQRKWFMALVQTTFHNHIMTLGGKFAIGKEDTVPDVSSVDDRGPSLESLAPPFQEEASILFALKNAPAELRDAVDRLLKDGFEGGAYLRTHLYRDGTRLRRMRRPIRETTSQYFERVTGVADLPDKLRAYLFA